MTREHLWPASLHKRLLEANKSSGSLFWLRRIKSEIQGEPTIRDVCQACNNGYLSELDRYIRTLFDRYFAGIRRRYEVVDFEYDYHPLKRWLLKFCFNSARMHNSLDLFAYPSVLPYLRGESLHVGRTIQLFLQLSYPGEVPRERLADPALQEAPVLREPQDNRVGFMRFEVFGLGRKVLRAVHLRSFSFFLAFSSPTDPLSVAEEFSMAFLSSMPATKLLSPSRSRIQLFATVPTHGNPLTARARTSSSRTHP
jgi:hypothetical protein